MVLLLFSTLLFNVKPAPVFADVYIGRSGPHRFLVDTGAETTLIDPLLAAKLRLKPNFRAELVTSQGSQIVPGTRLADLKIGNRVLPESEVLFEDVEQARLLDPKVEGVLGLNALHSFDFTLLPASGRLEDTSQRPAGEVVPYVVIQGRMAVKVQMRKETLTLILDSGSSHVVLFHLPDAMRKVNAVPSTFTTIDGARRIAATCWTEEMALTDNLKIKTLPAAIVQVDNANADGLLPVSVFKQLHVDQKHHELVVVR